MQRAGEKICLLITAASNNSMDVRARAATLFVSLSVSPTLRGGGFAPRHLKRSAAYLGLKMISAKQMEIIKKLEATKAATLEYYDLDDEQLDKSYGAGKWMIRYFLHHLADAETVLYDRVKRVISEPKQVLWAFDESAWAKELGYASLPLELSKRIYVSVRDGIIHHARLHYESSGHLEFVHSQAGVRTLKQEFDKIAAHNEHHLEQIKAALDAS